MCSIESRYYFILWKYLIFLDVDCIIMTISIHGAISLVLKYYPDKGPFEYLNSLYRYYSLID